MINEKKKWLAAVPWTAIVEMNQKLCKEPQTPHKPAASFSEVERLWESSAQQSMPPQAALDLCRQSHAMRPFAFFSGNTFCMVAIALFREEMQAMPSLDATILKNTVVGYVAETIKPSELEAAFRHADLALIKK